MKLNVIKPVICKHCKATDKLNIVRHQATWIYYLCDSCIEKSEEKED